MTNIRPDAKFLADCVRREVITPLRAKEYIRCPLIEITIQPDAEAPEGSWNRRVFDYGSDPKKLDLVGDEFDMFDEFVVMLIDDGSIGGYGSHPIYLYMKFEGERHYIELVSPIPGKKDGFAWSWESLNDEEMRLVNVSGFKGGKPSSKVVEDKMRGVTLNAIIWVGVFMQYHYEQNNFAIEVTPVKRDKTVPGLKGRLNMDSGPSIIYLDRLPRTYQPGDKPGEPTGVHQKPHQRPKYYRTLRADRYKNHPKYMVPKGVEVRASWVGDKEAIIEGNIYRLSNRQYKGEQL